MLRKKLGEILIERELITAEQLQQALDEQQSTGVRLGTLVIQKGWVSEDQMVDIVSERLNIPRVALSSMVHRPAGDSTRVSRNRPQIHPRANLRHR